MKNEIINWFKHDRSFVSGVALFHKFGKNLHLKALFNRQGETKYNTDLLHEELRRIAGISQDELKSLLSKPVRKYGNNEEPEPPQGIPETELTPGDEGAPEQPEGTPEQPEGAPEQPKEDKKKAQQPKSKKL